jgi:hypothetical protein
MSRHRWAIDFMGSRPPSGPANARNLERLLGLFDGRDQERVEADMTEDEIQATRERYHKWFEASGRFPRIVRLMDSGVDPDDPATRDERFQFGLDCLLDGIAARLAKRPGRGRAAH